MFPWVDEHHWYPKSRGRVLRHIGEDLERAAELVADHHVEGILDFKKEREAQDAIAEAIIEEILAGDSKK